MKVSMFRYCFFTFGLLFGLTPTVRSADVLSAGNGFTAAITADGDLSTWGQNDTFQLGHSIGKFPVAFPSAVARLSDGVKWTKVACGAKFTLAQASDGKLYSWGTNTNQQLGTGSITSEPGVLSLVRLPSDAVVLDFVAGESHALALVDLPTRKGVVFAWGLNSYGQLGQGLGDTVPRSTPTSVDITSGNVLLEFKSIAATNNSSFAIAKDGTLWAWGSNGRGELGQGKRVSTLPSSRVPIRVGKLKTWTAVFGGSSHVLALQGTKIFAWGSNAFGQCARGQSTSTVLSPVPITLPRQKNSAAPVVAKLAGGEWHSLALTTTGKVYAWGYNPRGALGKVPDLRGRNVVTSPFVVDLDDPASADPRKRIPLPAIVSVAAGDDFSTLLTATGGYLAFGVNNNGQLGLGSLETVPVNVGLPRIPLVTVPNLAVTAPVPVSDRTVGGLLNFGTGTTFGPINLLVRNTSAAVHSNSYRVSFYLSANSTLDAGDRLVSSKIESAPLGAGQIRGTNFTANEMTVPEVTPGTYFLLAQVVSLDANGNSLVDAFTPDNGVSVSVGLVGPNLVFSQIVYLDNTLVGDGLDGFGSVSLALFNTDMGTIPSGRSIKVEAYLSSDSILQPQSDALLKAIEVSVSGEGLVSGGYVNVDFGTIPVPSQIDGGDYFLIFVANRSGEIVESASALDTHFLNVRVAAHDLAITAPVLPTTPLGSASTLETVIVTVQNLGAKAYAGSYAVELYVSSKGTFDFTAARIAGPVSRSSLGARSSLQEVFPNVILPPGLEGNVTFFSKVITDVAVGDRFPLNNTSSLSANLAPAQLSITDFVFPNTSSVEAGGSFGAVSYRVANAGPGVLPPGFPINVEVYLSLNETLDRGADVRLDQLEYLGGLDSGESVALPISPRILNIPSGTPNGVYYLLVSFNGDDANSIFPSVVSGTRVNVGALDVSILAPSLIYTALGTNTVISGVNTTLTNQGGFAVPEGSKVELYRSRDAVLDNSDLLLKTITVEEPIPAAGNRAIDFGDVTIADSATGDYFLINRLVIPSGLIDLNSDNNLAASAITISRPNLTVEDFQIPAELDLDDTSPRLDDISFNLANSSSGVVPPGMPLVYELYLSKDTVFDSRDTRLLSPTSYLDGLKAFGDTTGASSVNIGPFSIDVANSFVGGTYYVLLVINRENPVGVDGGAPLVKSLEIRFKRVSAPGNGLDYGVTNFVGQPGSLWFITTDPRSTGGFAYESPKLAQGKSASIELKITGPTEVSVPWKLIAAGGDKMTVSRDGVLENELAIFDPVYKLSGSVVSGGVVVPGPIQVPEGEHTYSFTYTQNTNAVGNYGRIDLDLPAIITGGDADWYNDVSPSAVLQAKVNGNYARSPVLSAGQQASLDVHVQGPAQVAFWWRATGVLGQDKLSFYVDGELAQFPTKSMDEIARPAIISNQPEWRRVVFLIEPGPRVLRWVFAQGSEDSDAQGNVDGLVVMSPIPESNLLLDGSQESNNPLHALEYVDVPVSTTDISITGADAPVGTYLLDDAAGTGRLPVRVTFINKGREFSSSPTWSASNLELRLSSDQKWGNSDDIPLGNYARFQTLVAGNEVTFTTEVNLPFDLPSGVYFLLVRVRAFDDEKGEFTLANNSVILGQAGEGRAYTIRRAPDLRIRNLIGLSSKYPYHPEDAVYVSYSIVNLGLGDLLPTNRFKVQFSMYAVLRGGEITAGRVVRTYADREFSLFLPAASAAFPQSAIAEVNHFLDIPTDRDILVALGLVPVGTPEDSFEVIIARDNLANYDYYFVITVDAENKVVESSETNTTFFNNRFRVIPVNPFENVANFYGSEVFEDFLEINSALFTSVTFDQTAIPSLPNTFTDYIWDYALYRAPLGSPNLLFQEGEQNGVSVVNVPPYGAVPFNTLTFDFNVRATDVEIDVEVLKAGSSTEWESEPIYTLKPPYNEIFGERSLTGYGGLSSSPYIVALDGNVSFVQRVHAARVTFRDVVPTSVRSNPRSMRLVVRPAQPEVPPTPTGLTRSYLDQSIVIRWNGTIFSNEYGTQGAWIVERSRSGGPFTTLGSTSENSFTDSSPGTIGSNVYRVRGLSSAGASAAVETLPITLISN